MTDDAEQKLNLQIPSKAAKEIVQIFDQNEH